MRQTRLARTVLTGVLTLFLLYLGLSARTGWLPPIGVLDPHTAPLTYLVTNFVLLAVAAFSSITTLGAGLRGLALQPTSDSFTALAVVGAALQNAALLFDAKNFDPEAVTLFAPVAALLLCGALLVGRGFQRRVLREGDGDRLVEREHPPGLLRGRRRRDRRRRHEGDLDIYFHSIHAFIRQR